MSNELTYSQKVHKKYAEEHPDYFACGKRSVPILVEKAKKEAEQILKEFSVFYRGDIGITIEPKDHGLCYSITATLTVNGKPVRTEDPCDLLFIDLNELMLKRMLSLGIPSFGKLKTSGERKTTEVPTDKKPTYHNSPPKLSEEQKKLEKLMIVDGGRVYHYSYGTLLLIT